MVRSSPSSQAGPGAGSETRIQNLTIHMLKMCLSAGIAFKK